jgi:TatD DNase family protein
MIDSHCHLTDPRLHDQLDDVLARAISARVSQMITIGTELKDDLAAIKICRAHSNVRCAIGVHPNYCNEVDESELSTLREMRNDPSVVALGEMGLDYHYEIDRARQRRFFEFQLALAVEFHRPVVIHCREAVEDCLQIMRGFRVAAVFHCFTGTIAESERILDAGYLIGFTGAVTFKKSDDLRQVARQMPSDRLLVETDAPYLSPEPMRKQKINEPALVVHVASAIATARNVTVEEIDRITTENAQRFFGLSPSPSGRGAG